jgi:hypothetical protein
MEDQASGAPARTDDPMKTIRTLAVSDEVDQRIYSSTIRERMADVQMIIGCGDLPASYLEFLTDALHRPVYYVLGNHAEELTRVGERGEPRHPEGCTNVGFTVVRDPVSGLIIAGFPGSPRYSDADPVQFTEVEMAWRMLLMAPRLLWNRLRHGRALDLLVTHTPPRDVGDREDVAHRGFRSLRAFVKYARPAYLLHGHIHLYDRNEEHQFRFHDTEVINVYPYRQLDLDFGTLEGPPDAVTTPPGSIRAELDRGEDPVGRRA